MQENDLFVSRAANSYDSSVTDTQLWTAFGRALAAHRLSRGYDAPRDLKRAVRAAPNERTMEAIEDGRPGHTASITAYCEALGVSLVDVLASVLPDAKLSAGALAAARRYAGVSPAAQAAVEAVLAIAPRAPTTLPQGLAESDAATPERKERVVPKRTR